MLTELRIKQKNRLVEMMKRRPFRFFGHVIRRDGLEKVVKQGLIEGNR